MLDFWYSERCTRQLKLLLCIGVFALLYYCNNLQELPQSLALSSLAIGFLVHFVYKIRLNTSKKHIRLYAKWLYLILMLVWFGLITQLPKTNQLLSSIQLAGYSLLGFFLVTIYSQRSRRHDLDKR
ncbi:hypothetical protein [Acinetobacter rudis]|uniref:Uncharacterized protein n=1 Tax=Acinetobacter rudis TaxID=632955 RepID=A0AAW8J6M0_9GAMM|nr:hypothetical protein [Acinetobacter rudis]MDQ8935083.1 hypothetical protein [Acinetobacter rudis]MDQ8952946.1 hypothetical protein [Acinetobacter rudis]MDQ9016951.1 hypothetical protein [Acinetobacter rudis]